MALTSFENTVRIMTPLTYILTSSHLTADTESGQRKKAWSRDVFVKFSPSPTIAGLQVGMYASALDGLLGSMSCDSWNTMLPMLLSSALSDYSFRI